MTDSDRRQRSRIPVEMWVQETRGRDVYFMRASNVSLGGVFLDCAVPHPVGTAVLLEFILPGQTHPLRVRGRVVNHPNMGGELGMGVEFAELDSLTARAIADFAGRAAR